jgi:EpsI family protein
MLAIQEARIEPITYWITVGDTAVRGGWEQRLAEVKYGLTGKVPDGILVRVSNISTDAPDSYRLHDSFVNDMLKAMKHGDQLRLVGQLVP